MDKNSFFNRIEPFIVYIILYFPSFYDGGNRDAAAFYTNSSLLIMYSVISLFQILFLLYLMKLKNTAPGSSGLKRFSFASASKAVIYAAFLMIIIILLNSLLKPLTEEERTGLAKSVSFILKALAVSLLTGYREEAFFRSYFISASENYYGIIISVFISTVLFSVSHASGGISAVLSAMAAGFFLSYIFIRHRNLHINALAHSIYNFAVLIFS